MTFREVFQQTEVAEGIEPGIRALGHYSRLIETQDTIGFEGSVDMDGCLVSHYPQASRWDYAFGHRDRIYYVEVHPVTDSEVSVVIAKYHWLIDWQNRQPNPTQLKTNSSYHWLSTGHGGLTARSQYMRQLAKAGLAIPKKTLKVPV